MEKFQIHEKKILAAYEELRNVGDDRGIAILESLFGKETFVSADVTERVRTFEDAVNALGDTHPLVIQYYEIYGSFLEGAAAYNSCDIVAYLKLRIICAALNDGWEPQFSESEYRYFPYFEATRQEVAEEMETKGALSLNFFSVRRYNIGIAGLRYSHSIAPAPSGVGDLAGRLWLKSEVLAEYCGRQFIDLWADFYLIRKRQ